MDDTRVLVAARLSRLVKDRDQLSIERQDDAARRYAADAGDPDPILAADAGVSGSVSPFSRQKLAPYLTDNPPEQWTELVASAIDRLGRNARDLYDLRNWCEDHGKRITILSPRLHWPPSEDDFASRIVWTVLEQLAEIELRQTKKRYAETRAYLRSRNSMIGKQVWGFMIVGPTGGKTLAPDPEKRAYLIAMIDMALAGKSQQDIARWLTSEEVPAPKWEIWFKKEPEARKRAGEPSRAWTGKSVGQVLRHESLYGVCRENGRILLRHDGVIDRQRWDQLQAKLDANPKRRGPTRNDPMMLTDVIYCGKCQRIMHARRYPRQAANSYYRCDGTPHEPSTCRNMVRTADIEQWVNGWFTVPADAGGSGFAEAEIIETVPIPAQGFTDEIAQVDQDIDELDKNDPGYLAEVNRLYAERERLVSLGTIPAHTEDRPTGVYLGDYWRTLDVASKRDHLRRAGIKVYAIGSSPNRWMRGDPHKVMGALTRK